uniref:Retrovirus-related Pol polyprotein from transposon TNT 1-94 n=1 Tax=Cajanus cajan TaxID=3821 RepID=A0A151QYH0_CAJCA|nr:Retrovirus-related Pol polyprotein from transposon TNT 1-94 [Cajanus cajan]
MDVKNAFLHGDLKEEIYMKLPSSMTTSSPNDVCKLRRSLYRLKQALRAWFEKFHTTLLNFSFTQSQYDYSLFFHKSLTGIVLILVYVDDLIITGTDTRLITKLQVMLHATFCMKDLGQLTYFLGLEVHHRSNGIYLNQHKKDEGDLLADPTIYRGLVGSLIYLMTNRLDISYVVHQVSQFMSSPQHLHFAAIRRIIRYLIGSPTRWCMFLDGAFISWKCKKQDRVSKSFTEAEYRSMSSACSEIVWLHCLLEELGFSQPDSTPLHADNTSAIQIASNLVFHEHTKHIEVDVTILGKP